MSYGFCSKILDLLGGYSALEEVAPGCCSLSRPSLGIPECTDLGKLITCAIENFSGHLSLWIKAKVKASTPGPEISVNMGS